MPLPKLDGKPSPALRKMQRMEPDELRQHLERMRLERDLAIAAGAKTPGARFVIARIERLLEVGEELLETGGVDSLCNGNR